MKVAKSPLPQHQRLVVNSAISSEVASARGYRSVTTKAELRRLGFKDSQCRVPSLLIPIWGVTGEIVNYQLRPDQPRINHRSGKAVKYETVAGSRMTLDVPPTIRSGLGTPKKPLFITEGARKADAAVSKGLCCIAVLGVWNWRGTNEFGGKTVLADWEYVALNNRDAYIVFDSDVMTKPEVHAALGRLQSLLKHRGANVSFAYLPPTEEGKKVGLDDFFAAGNDIPALMALMSPELRDMEDPAKGTRGLYVIENGCICHRKCNKDGEVFLVPLCNFEARIVSEVIRDDGGNHQLFLEIEARRHGETALPTIQIPAAQFASMNWVLSSWGVGAVVSAGFGAKDRLREAIQVHSADVERRHVYIHTGWRKIDNDWVYLHAGGAIGRGGNITAVIVEPEGPLAQIRLDSAPEGQELCDAVKASIGILELAPDWISVPTLGAVYRAVLSEILTADFSLHYSGSTGVFKSELAALAQGHFGAGFRRENLPANWRSTANFLELQTFLAKDSILVIDDFAPCGTQADIARLHRDADKVFRGAGNHSGRGRLRSDSSARRSYVPRSLIISTGEDIPRGQSLRSRLLVVEVSSGDVDPEKLTVAQATRDKGMLCAAMSGFLKWIAPQVDDLKKILPKFKQELCYKAAREAFHRRTPDIVAHLAVGLKLFLDFACEVEAISQDERQEYWLRAWVALGEVAARQAQYQSGEDPANRFLQLITAAITSGAAYVSDRKSGEEPVDASCWGWREITIGQGTQWQPRGTRVGWLDGYHLYLEPDTAFAVAQRFARDQGDGLSVTKNTLWKRMKERGLLASFEKGKNLMHIRTGVKRRCVVHVSADNLESIPTISGTTETLGTPPSVDSGFSLPSLVLESKNVKTEGQESELESPIRPESIPIVPDVPEMEDRAPEEQEIIALVQPLKTDAQEKEEGFYP